jgi:hypothetical protein
LIPINQSTVKKITKEDNEKILEKILNKDSGEDKKKESKLP